MNSQVSDKLANYLATDELFGRVFGYAKQRFNAAPELTAHNWEHARRDVLNGILIGEAENADMTIVLPALALHDIGFLYGASGKTHGAIGAERLDEFLGNGKIDIPAERRERIRACIRTHKGSMHGEGPETLEAKVVSDADFIEKFGPIGVYQTIRTFGEFNYDASRIINSLTVMHEFELQTGTGRMLKQQMITFNNEFAAALATAYEPYREQEVIA